jgi:hypothetical protein
MSRTIIGKIQYLLAWMKINHASVENDEPHAIEVLNQTKNKVRPLIFHNGFTFIYMTLQSNASRLLTLHQYRVSCDFLHSLTASDVTKIASVCLQQLDNSRLAT